MSSRLHENLVKPVFEEFVHNHFKIVCIGAAGGKRTKMCGAPATHLQSLIASQNTKRNICIS